MKYSYAFFAMILLVLMAGCQQDETMVLLDEKIEKVEVSESIGAGDVNDDILMTFTDRSSIRTFERAITSAVKQDVGVGESIPDFDILIGYEKGLPTHAIHIWLEDENEKSILMYMVGAGQTYVTSGKMTNELRKLLLSDE